MEQAKKDKNVKQAGDFDRRDLMKLGVAGAGLAMSVAPALGAAALSPQQTSAGQRTAAPEPAGRRQLGPPTGLLRPSTTRGVQQWPLIAGSQVIVASGQVGYTVHTGPGWKNDSGRANGNGPMDETTRRITDFVDWYNESKLTPKLIETINYLMADTGEPGGCPCSKMYFAWTSGCRGSRANSICSLCIADLCDRNEME